MQTFILIHLCYCAEDVTLSSAFLTLKEAIEHTNQSNKLQDYYYTTVTIDLFTNQFMETLLKDT